LSKASKNIKQISLRGACEHNLQSIDVDIPRDQLVVITGPSGSGKSSLAFDTIFAEAQRRYVESLSTYARQFLEQLSKPEFESISGLSPAIAIEQKTTARSPRSTVGTITEIYDYLRLLFARAGTPWCPNCDKPISRQTPQNIVDSILQLEKGTRVQLMAPVIRGKKGSHSKVLEEIQKQGFVRIRIDGEIQTFDDEISLAKTKAHDIDIVVDRIVVADDILKRLSDSVELCLKHGNGLIRIWSEPKGGSAQEELQSEHFACLACGIYVPELEPRMFSFNSPHGACKRCSGLGTANELDPALIVPNQELSIKGGAVSPWYIRPKLDAKYRRLLTRVCKHYEIDMDIPWSELPGSFKDVVINGSGDELGDFSIAGRRRKRGVAFDGVIKNLKKRYKNTDSEKVREFIAKFMNTNTCPDCKGARLRSESLMVRVADKSLPELCGLSIENLHQFFDTLALEPHQKEIATPIASEIERRLQFLVQTGLTYLSLDRSADTLSGGEAQRIRLARQIGAGLSGVLYVLDEPSIGLHHRDNNRLIQTLKNLRDIGNSVLVVEHDKDTILAADHVLDIGPKAGVHGGKVVAEGTPEQIKKSKNSITGQYLNGKLETFEPKKRKANTSRQIKISGATLHNLKSVDVAFPLSQFICVTGVSGSGKSSLINETLYPALMRELHSQTKLIPGPYDKITGLKEIDKVISIDQSAIGRTPRSNPATYVGLFAPIRTLFSKVPDSRMRGWGPGRFSFNVKGGRCEKCQGGGLIKIEMQFMPDMYVGCPDCDGARYNRDTLEIRYKGLNISEVLDLTIEEGCEVFRNVASIASKLNTMRSVGLGYLRLGQSSTTLSGGEAQRVKLSSELSKRQTGKTLYILDEPTTGLHAIDIDVLLRMLHELVDHGNTVVVIEHNIDVIRSADWIIDLGPEGGEGGGEIVCCGKPAEIAKCGRSHTGVFL
jgi:excinuclease ABC subunit A